ncbi:hemK methyltransferase family member [Thalictrum thalictroides]|uniref:HemK methyltransferase family member n=1 Tax=Thalictrum thalictroides TaxID=46969 RepID=A0A7J6V5T0_THATH|nr:hemK methyltransferase family member [Thalictrum thalictroides]
MGFNAEVICDNVASGLERRLEGMIDVIVVNPPYIPTPEDEVGKDGIASAWAAGENGRSVINRILPVADKLLSNKGYASRIVVQRSTEEESLHVIKFWRDAESESKQKK